MDSEDSKRPSSNNDNSSIGSNGSSSSSSHVKLADDSQNAGNNQYQKSNIFIKIDNLPPGKSWKQVKYLIGGIIHYSNVLQVRMLPPLTSIVPPFISFQSSIVVLTPSMSAGQINHLLMSLNTYQWDYYNLFAYAVPSSYSFQMYSTPPPVPPAQQFMAPMHNASPRPTNFPLLPPQPQPMYQQNMFTLLRHPYHQKFPPADTVDNTKTSDPSQLLKLGDLVVSETAESQENGMHNSNKDARSLPTGKKKLRQIFNEKSFRRQMTNRNMWQLKIENFPPFLQTDTMTIYDKKDNEKVLKVEQFDKFGRLRWTILKNYIKLKCPKLLELDQNDSQTINLNNTKEFYVGVYEDHEEEFVVETMQDGKQGLYKMAGTIYKAIIGFHDKEICDSVQESLQNQEYSMGYDLSVAPLEDYKD